MPASDPRSALEIESLRMRSRLEAQVIPRDYSRRERHCLRAHFDVGHAFQLISKKRARALDQEERREVDLSETAKVNLEPFCHSGEGRNPVLNTSCEALKPFMSCAAHAILAGFRPSPE
jgi:hypothetical protein